jgi:hypothetical protein
MQSNTKEPNGREETVTKIREVENIIQLKSKNSSWNTKKNNKNVK